VKRAAAATQHVGSPSRSKPCVARASAARLWRQSSSWPVQSDVKEAMTSVGEVEKLRASPFLVLRAMESGEGRRRVVGGNAMREVGAGFPSHQPPCPSITGRVCSMIFRSSKAD
jgi:hypothetical protein